MINDTCATCTYFSQVDKYSKNNPTIPLKGSCFRFPPQVCMDDKGAFRSQWPKVSSITHCCGEYYWDDEHCVDIHKDEENEETNKQRERLLKLYGDGEISTHDFIFEMDAINKQSNSTN